MNRSAITNSKTWRSWWLNFGSIASWKAIIAESGLPNRSREILRETVSKTRLLNHEKRRVAQELVDHFYDGLLSGKSESQMIDNFGSPEITSKLIRLSCIRNRPPMYRFLQFTAYFSAAVAGVYLILLGYYHSAKPTITKDYLAVLNQSSLQLDEEQKAWPIYRAAWLQYGFNDYTKFDWSVFENPDSVGRDDRYVAPGHEKWPVVVKRLGEIEELIDAIRLASHKEHLGLVIQTDARKYSPEDLEALYPGQEVDQVMLTSLDYKSTPTVNQIMGESLSNVLMPHIYSLRNCVVLLQLDTRLAVELDDSARALSNIQSMLRICGHVGDAKIMVGSVSAVSLGFSVINTIEETLNKHPDFFSPEELSQLQSTLHTMDVVSWMDFDGDKAFIYDIVQRTFTEDGNGNGRLTVAGVELTQQSPWEVIVGLSSNTPAATSNKARPQEPWIDWEKWNRVKEKVLAPTAVFRFADRKETLAKTEELFELYSKQLQVPFWSEERVNLDNVWDQEFEDSDKFSFLAEFFPAMEPVRIAKDRLVARKSAAITAIAAHRYLADHGNWPPSLRELTPLYINKIPKDPISGDDLRMAIHEGIPLYYSVSFDLDDDRGKQANEDVTSYFSDNRVAPHDSAFGGCHSKMDCDWTLWPQLTWRERLPETAK